MMRLRPYLSLIFFIALVAPGCRCASGGTRANSGASGEHIRVLEEVELESGGNLVLVQVGDRTLLVGTSENDPPTLLGDVDPETLGFTLNASERGASGGAGNAGQGAGSAWERGDLAEQRGEEEGEPQSGGEVVVQLYSQPPSLNYIIHSDWWLSRITSHNVYESLVGIDPYDHPDYGHRPELAERWEISEDNRIYTFHLRRGVQWHDGRDFTARDVIATFDKVSDDGVRSGHLRSYIEELESYEALDDYTVRFTWRRPYFLSMDTPFAGFPIQPAHIISELSASEYNEASTNPLTRHPIGTGPFRFEEWETGERIVIARFDDYWGQNAHLDRVVFRIVTEAPVGIRLGEREELDVVTRIRAEAWRDMDNPVLR